MERERDICVVIPVGEVMDDHCDHEGGYLGGLKELAKSVGCGVLN